LLFDIEEKKKYDLNDFLIIFIWCNLIIIWMG